MIRLRTLFRQFMLSGWNLPPNFSREMLTKDDGTISVLLEYQGVTRAANFGSRGIIAWSAYAELASLAAEMLTEASENDRRSKAANDLMRRNAMISEERRFASECGEACRGGAKLRHGIGPVAG